MQIAQKKIEQTVLVSFIKDNNIEEIYQENLKYLQDLKIEIFQSREHQHILRVLQTLDQNNYDLESILIESKLNEKAQKVYIEVLTTNPVTTIYSYIKMLHESYQKEQLQKEAVALRKAIVNGDKIDINKLRDKLDGLENLSNKNQRKPRTQRLKDKFKVKSKKSKDLKDIKIEYLNKIIVKKEITMIAAAPGIGKSLTTLAMINEALKRDKTVEDVFYFDMDNSVSTLAERDLSSVLDNHQDRLYYMLGADTTPNELDRDIKELCNTDLENCVVIFDSAKNFMRGGDRDKNKDVSKITEIFKQMRNNGATIIFLHHTNKPQKDLDSLYAGSSAWGEDITNGFLLVKNEEKETFIFKNSIKNRAGKLPKEIAFKYTNNLLHEVDIDNASLTREDEDILDDIKIYLLDNAQNPQNRTQNKIVKYLTNEGYGRNQCVKLLQSYVNKKWTLIPQNQLNGRKVYMQIKETNKDHKITEFNNTQNTSSPQETLGQVGQWDTELLKGYQNQNVEIPDIF